MLHNSFTGFNNLFLNLEARASSISPVVRTQKHWFIVEDDDDNLLLVMLLDSKSTKKRAVWVREWLYEDIHEDIQHLHTAPVFLPACMRTSSTCLHEDIQHLHASCLRFSGAEYTMRDWQDLPELHYVVVWVAVYWIAVRVASALAVCFRLGWPAVGASGRTEGQLTSVSTEIVRSNFM